MAVLLYELDHPGSYSFIRGKLSTRGVPASSSSSSKKKNQTIKNIGAGLPWR